MKTQNEVEIKRSFFLFFHIFSTSNFIANRQIQAICWYISYVCSLTRERDLFISIVIIWKLPITRHFYWRLYHFMLPAKKKILSLKKIRIIGENYILEKFVVTTRVFWHLVGSRSLSPGYSRAILSRMSNFIYDEVDYSGHRQPGSK